MLQLHLQKSKRKPQFLQNRHSIRTKKKLYSSIIRLKRGMGYNQGQITDKKVSKCAVD